MARRTIHVEEKVPFLQGIPLSLQHLFAMNLLRAAHPKLQVHLPQSSSNIIVEDVRAGRVDGGFAFVSLPESESCLPHELAYLHLSDTSMPASASRVLSTTGEYGSTMLA